MNLNLFIQMKNAVGSEPVRREFGSIQQLFLFLLALTLATLVSFQVTSHTQLHGDHQATTNNQHKSQFEEKQQQSFVPVVSEPEFPLRNIDFRIVELWTKETN